MQNIIYIPGLHDQIGYKKFFYRKLSDFWINQDINFVVFEPRWEEGSLKEKMSSLLHLIDLSHKKNDQVFLIGQSAGGSFALNAFVERKNIIHKVVNLTGRLKAGVNVHPSLSFASRGSRSFRESVLLFENVNEKKLSSADREKVLTVRPFVDLIVPSSTVAVKGATNIVIPYPGHSIGGIAAPILYKNYILRFLNS